MFYHSKHFLYKLSARLVMFICILCLCGAQSLPVLAITETAQKRIDAQRLMPVASNEIENWPTGPVVNAEAAILMEAKTGAILYAKNIHKQEYPASTTKILTSLIAIEQCSMDEIVTFSHDAVFGIPLDSNHIAMNEGDTLTMEQCLNAILIRSANEVSYAVAEHIGGTWDDFADIMNKRAEELGCVDSHFVNPNGLPDEDHYTSAYDLAMIGRAFFSSEILCRMTMTPMLVLEKKTGEYRDKNKMELIPGGQYEYKYLVGCKTGFTNDARYTLVSCAEKDGLKLICVIMKDENNLNYEDTIALFDYGFANFAKVNISQAETKYNIDNTGSFYSDYDVFGNSQPILALNKEDYIVLPKTADFADTVSSISYETQNENQAAIITYTYHGEYIGSASVDLSTNTKSPYAFDVEPDVDDAAPKSGGAVSVVFVNIFKVLFYVLVLAAGCGIIYLLVFVYKNYYFSSRNTRRSWLRDRRRRKRPLPSSDDLARSRRKEIMAAKRRQRRKNSFRTGRRRR
ncbi:MAG: D-alanyl-D-alanine carboxypeptidase [Lachnoclostridium sp.]|nr:D-alanyl-D-alanine carboxypeptidase [Lachnospira sp.]MCM1248212.1 D-alanyl-D-alanine carboxypeptidase [Lachnoclostridium sp.]MCM1535000.1 D-alanyl-D-alanine carboxypeptidase [Clostridium sp.]